MRIGTFLSVLLFSSALWAAEVYLPGTADVPLYDGLVVRESGEDIQFDTPEGQILIIEADSKKKTAAEVLGFYRKALPALGWKEVKTGVFEREKDSFSIVIVQKEKPLVVRFELMPKE